MHRMTTPVSSCGRNDSDVATPIEDPPCPQYSAPVGLMYRCHNSPTLGWMLGTCCVVIMTAVRLVRMRAPRVLPDECLLLMNVPRKRESCTALVRNESAEYAERV